jgi:O-antigen ligase
MVNPRQVVNPRQGVRVLSAAERARQSKRLIEPNPGDLIVLLVFGWAVLCFFMVTIGDRLLQRVARLSSSQVVTGWLLESAEAFAILMVVVSIVLTVVILAATKFQKFLPPVLVVSMNFADVPWQPLHDPAFFLKYLCLIYLGAYTAFFFYKNFWRLVATPYVRLILLYIAWVAGVAFFVGGKMDDIWYAGTEFTLFLGLAVAWLYFFTEKYGIEKFWECVVWGCVATTVIHLLAPLVVSNFLVNYRYVSYYGIAGAGAKATGFAITQAPVALILFWAAMAAKNQAQRGLFTGIAMSALFLVIWSGSRSPTAATLIGIGILWWLFRTKSIVVMMYLGMLAIAVLVVFGVGTGVVDFEALASRLETDDTGRFELWEKYFEAVVRSPLWGHAPSGYRYAVIGESLGAFISGLNIKIGIAGIHNSYLGMLLRFGGVGLALLLTLIFLAMSRARQVLLSKAVPFAEKRLYILPAAIVPVICAMILFEDRVPGSGKGTSTQIFLYTSLVILQVYGTRLLQRYERVVGSKLETLEGFAIESERKDLKAAGSE